MNYTLENFTIPIENNSCIDVNGNYLQECIYKNICSGYQSYFINIGLFLIIFYIVMSWALWFLFSQNNINKIFKLNLTYEQRIYWNQFIRDKIQKMFLIYVGYVVFLNIL